MTDSGTRRATRREIAAAGYWFGPRRFGWGWSPVSWQGWLVVAALIGAIVGVGRTDSFRNNPLPWMLALIAVTLALCLWKGTAPGPSRRANRQLEEIAARRDAEQ